MERFYVDVLGYVVEWRPSERELYLTRGEDNLALHQGGRPSSTGHHAGLRREQRRARSLRLLMDTATTSRWATHLEAHGVVLDTRPRCTATARPLLRARPEGNRIQFSTTRRFSAPVR